MSKHAAVSPRTRRPLWIALAVSLALMGTASIVSAVHRSSPPSAVVVRDAAPTASPGAPAVQDRPSVRRNAAGGATPVHLSIPAIAVSHDLLKLGLNPDGTVEVPPHSNSGAPGWFRLGPTPGRVGSSVILGHVDSLEGPAVFYRLKDLKRGDLIDVDLKNGTVAHFAVQRVATYLNKDFPAREVYGSHGYAALNLVTCGGRYDKARGGYQSNVVAYTNLVGSPPLA